MSQPFIERVRKGRSPINGTGVFARELLPARRKLGELTGELAPARAAERAQRDADLIYYVEVGDGLALDCRRGNLFRHLNHSCDANAYLRVVGTRVEVYSRRPIAEGEEITVDYGHTPHRKGMLCTCGSERCRGLL